MPAPKGNKFAVGNKGGRPSKLTPELLAHAHKYIESCNDDIQNKRVSLPSVEGLARWLNVSRDTILNFSSENEEFFGIYEDVKAEQAKRLQDNGLAGTYNSTIARLILASKHGFVEQTDITSGGKPLAINFDPTFGQVEDGPN